MPSPETGSSLWYVLFNLHVRISEANQLDLITLSSQNSKLLFCIRSSLWFVEPGERLTPVGDSSPLGSLNVLA